MVQQGKGRPIVPAKNFCFCLAACENFLLQHLQDLGGIAAGRLADQQMDVLRHDQVTNEPKPVTRTHLVEDSYKAVPGANGSEVGPPAITAEGEEMKVAMSIETPQRVAHIKSR